MARQVIIDGNNLMFAMHEHAPVPAVGRETMVQVVARWAARTKAGVTVVFDGPPPPVGLSKQMRMRRVLVEFSAPSSADDVIAEMVKRTRDPGSTTVISSDRAVRYEAKMRRCRHVDAVEFVGELFSPGGAPTGEKGTAATASAEPDAAGEKPPKVSEKEMEEWLDFFDIGDEEFRDDIEDMMA